MISGKRAVARKIIAIPIATSQRERERCPKTPRQKPRIISAM
jgi:hypothetical protein